MEILGRHHRQYAQMPRRLRAYLALVRRAVRVFQRPTRVLFRYMWGGSLPCLDLRNGMRLHMSECKEDLRTAVVVLARQEYGDVPRGGIVLDLGANIGAFALLAAAEGCRVFAYEPGAESFATLQRNITANDLADRVCAQRFAIWDGTASHVEFPTKSHPGNAVARAQAGGPMEPVSTITLQEVMHRHDLQTVDLVKMDCEGAEYRILSETPTEAWLPVRRVVIEYHDGRADALADVLRGAGFQTEVRESGAVWGHDYGILTAWK